MKDLDVKLVYLFQTSEELNPYDYAKAFSVHKESIILCAFPEAE